MIDLNKLAKEIHKNAVAKGFWDRDDAEEIMFAWMHAELSEALNEDRLGRPMAYVDDFDLCERITDVERFGGRKPEGVAVELADFIILLLDWAAQNELEIYTPGPFDDKEEDIKDIPLHVIVNSHHEDVCRLWNPVMSKSDQEYYVARDVSGINAWLASKGYDLAEIVRLKMDYNKARPRMHGRKY